MSDTRVLKQNVEDAINLFIQNDTELLNLRVYELAVSHRIAVYLEKIFDDKGLNFDCEYDKRFDLKKPGPDDKPMRPDILVHTRNSQDNNKLAIEIKKQHVFRRDIEKLKMLTNQDGIYKYALGVFIYFLNGEPQYKWFENGTEI